MLQLPPGRAVRSILCSSIFVALAALAVAPGQVSAPVTAQEPPLIRFEASDTVRWRATLQALQDGLPYVPGELLVRFNPDADPGEHARALSVLRTDVRASNVRWIGDVVHLHGLGDVDPVRAAEDLQRQPEVIYAQPNYIRPLKSRPNDPNYAQQWHFDAIDLPRAWDINPGGRDDVIVAVLDSGLSTTTATFGFRIWNGEAFQVFGVPFAQIEDFDHARVRRGREFAFGLQWITPSGENLVFDADGHGSHVAGTIAQQTNNGIGFAGVAHATTILPVKVCWSYWDLQLALGAEGSRGFAPADFNGCDDSAIVEGLRYAADNGARVINMSLGGEPPAPALEEALEYAVSRGAFVSIAAGNEALEGNPTSYPAAYAPDIDGVVAVGAVTRASTRARYSNFGPYVELVAPGGDGAAQANAVWQMAPDQDDLAFELLSPRFDRFQSLGINGTSMAAPHVAGVAALLYSQGITNPAAIEAALKRFARDLGPAGRDDEYGHGVVDARAALRGLGVVR
ncbi:MAG TPA: S8 family serine peptidase [Vicinamibacterales bacterium]|nr:S8 family serine peptidase [Vicinamibacterales bacterium]